MRNICIPGSNNHGWETRLGVPSDEHALFFLSFSEWPRGVRNAFYFYSSCFLRVKGYGLRSLIKSCASLKKRNSLSCTGSARWEINSCLWLYVTISSARRHINIQIYRENGYMRPHIQTHTRYLRDWRRLSVGLWWLQRGQRSLTEQQSCRGSLFFSGTTSPGWTPCFTCALWTSF